MMDFIAGFAAGFVIGGVLAYTWLRDKVIGGGDE